MSQEGVRAVTGASTAVCLVHRSATEGEKPLTRRISSATDPNGSRLWCERLG
jgi:hypothetical protein